MWQDCLRRKNQAFRALPLPIQSWVRQQAAQVASTPQSTWQARIDQAIRLRFPAWKLAAAKEGMTAQRLLAALLLLETIMNSAGDDAQLANLKLQTETQMQQQTMSLMSTLLKSSNDVMMDIIRNMKQ
jgi:hypothetical protein